jgi:WD40 repeat protein
VDKTVKLWELVGRDGSAGYGHTAEVKAVAVSPDGKLLATGSADRTIRLWDLATGAEKGLLTGHANAITALAFTPDSKQLVSADEKTLHVWDVAQAKEVVVCRDAISNEAPIIIVLAGGKEARVWVANRLIETYDLVQGKQLQSWSGHDRDISSLAFSSDGEYAALGGVDGTVRLWNVPKRERLKLDGKEDDLAAHTEAIADLAFTPDKKFLITADKAGSIKVWDLAKRQTVRELPKQKQPVVASAMSADGKRFATATMDNVIKVWDVAKGQELRKWELRVPLQANRPFVRNLAFTPDGKFVATANANTTAYLLECP